jgi:linoleoyl-CoA desaturase
MPHQLPVALDDAELDSLAGELDAIRGEVKASLGARDRRYVRRVIAVQRGLGIAGRVLIFASLPLLFLASWPGAFLAVIAAGTVALALSKILENMELGHNVMHGQWDWMRDPRIHSTTWEWDTVCPSDQWKHSHNDVHHVWANVIGRDRDLGYTILRVHPVQPWSAWYLLQPIYSVVLALLFEWGVALYNLDFEALRRGDLAPADFRRQFREIRRKMRRQLLKDYVLWPLCAGPWFLPVLLANVAANVIRSVWGYAIIFCGHFPDGVHVFTEAQIAGESRGGWYVRQILGACNIRGGRLFHVVSGHLGHQIEHHLFPDLPSRRYPEIAPRVQALCARYGIPYNSASLARQFGTTLWAIWRLALPPRPGRIAVDTRA